MRILFATPFLAPSTQISISPTGTSSGECIGKTCTENNTGIQNGAKSLCQDQVHLSQQSRELAQLQSRDREVRAHEAAHAAAAGPVATSGPHFTYERGPDGQLYAVGGEVNIDTSPVPNDPEATIRKAQTIRTAALAPANPSAQDRAVAAQAGKMEAQARREIQQQQTAYIHEVRGKGSSAVSTTHQKIDLFA